MSAVELSERHEEFGPLDPTLGILSGKWRSIVLCRLMAGDLHFGELLRAIPSCSKRTLALQLSDLEADGIVVTAIEAETLPVRTQYHLTELGESLGGLAREMDDWGRRHLERMRPTAAVSEPEHALAAI